MMIYKKILSTEEIQIEIKIKDEFEKVEILDLKKYNFISISNNTFKNLFNLKHLVVII